MKTVQYQGFIIKPAPLSPTSVMISFDGKGKLASALEGLYTSVGAAKDRIDKYLTSQLKKS